MFKLKNLSVCILLTALLPITLFAQETETSMIVGSVGGEDISYGELLDNYSSNNTSDEISFEDLKNFLPVYLDYKAKILAGEEMDYHKDSSLVAEYNNYTKQAAYSHWLEKEIKPSAFQEFKQRSAFELKAFHILIAVDQNASESEMDEAVTKLKQAKAELENGTDPEEVDEKYSTTRNGQGMGGDLPWISAGRTVKVFEDQVYELEAGEVSEPFRTQFGYHIILLQDKRERIPSRLVRHIFVQQTNDSSAYDKIRDAYQQLESGTSWDEAVASYSEDRSSLQNNGRIGWINYQVNSNDFIDTVMNVDANLPFTEPKESSYGYHIFRVDSVESYPNEEARDKVLREQLENTPYYQSNNEFVLNYLEDVYQQEISDEDVVELTNKRFPEFREQSESFLNGLIVFKFNEDQLWDPATVDSTRLRSIYNSNSSEYQYPERPFYYLITARNDSTLDKAIEFVDEGGALDSLSSRISGLNVTSDSTTSSLSPPFDRLQKMAPKSFSNKFDYNNGRGLFWFEENLEARKMTFEEAFNLLLNKYQPEREQELMENLREKYDIIRNYSQLREAYQKDS